MARHDPQFKLRMSERLHEQIAKLAEDNARSMNAEIVARLERTIEQDAREAAVLEQVEWVRSAAKEPLTAAARERGKEVEARAMRHIVAALEEAARSAQSAAQHIAAAAALEAGSEVVETKGARSRAIPLPDPNSKPADLSKPPRATFALPRTPPKKK